MSTTGTKGRRKRLSRNDWLQHAMETLRSEGVGGLQVEPLAKSLGVTAGSFYWHFKDRQNLLDAVLDHWTERMVTALNEHAPKFPGDPKTRLLSLIEEIELQDRGRYELAVRVWAFTDKRAQRAVKTVDRKRLDYVGGMFREMGFQGDDAVVRARLMMCYQIAEPGVTPRATNDERADHRKIRHGILTNA